MTATLYLNPEVLHLSRAGIGPTHTPRSSCRPYVVEPISLLEQMVTVFPDTHVVLHSYSIKELGYRHVVCELSPLIRSHVIGSTYAGNRLCRFHCNRKSRREWLCADMRRRAPTHPIVVDSDWKQVLPGLEEVTLIVSPSRSLGTVEVANKLLELLREVDTSACTYVSPRVAALECWHATA